MFWRDRERIYKISKAIVSRKERWGGYLFPYFQEGELSLSFFICVYFLWSQQKVISPSFKMPFRGTSHLVFRIEAISTGSVSVFFLRPSWCPAHCPEPTLRKGPGWQERTLWWWKCPVPWLHQCQYPGCHFVPLFIRYYHQFSSVQPLSRVRPFATPWTAARQASLCIINSQSLLKLTSIESVMPSNHLIPFSSCLHSFPASGSFPMSQFFTSGGQSIGVSALAWVLPMNIQDWFPLGLTGLISLQSKRLSGVFSNTAVQKHQFFSAQLSLCPTLTSIHDYRKNHIFD